MISLVLYGKITKEGWCIAYILYRLREPTLAYIGLESNQLIIHTPQLLDFIMDILMDQYAVVDDQLYAIDRLLILLTHSLV